MITGPKTLAVAYQENTGEARSGEVTVADQKIKVTQQEGKCSYDVQAHGAMYNSQGNGVILPYTPLSTNVSLGAGRANLIIRVMTSKNCAWSVASSPSWLSPSKANMKGYAEMNVNVPPNKGDASRTGIIVVAGKSITVTQDAACAYDVKAQGANYDADGKLILPYTPLSTSVALGGSKAQMNVQVKTGKNCPWSIKNNPMWISGISSPAKGDGTLALTVSPNPQSSARSGSFMIGDKTIAVTQAVACTVDVKAQGANYDDKGKLVLPYSPLSESVSLGGAKASLVVQVKAPAACPWSVTSSPAWVPVSKASNKGTMTLAIPIAANTSSASRSGTLAIGGKTITVTQAVGCSYEVKAQGANYDDKGNLTLPYTPLSDSVSLSGAKANLIVQVKTASSCPWTVTSGTSWIAAPKAGNKGNATLNIPVAANTSSASRSGTFAIAGKTIAVTQGGGCTYDVKAQGANYDDKGNLGTYTPLSTSVALGGKKANIAIQVKTSSSCTWSVASMPNWVSVSKANNKGNMTLNATVAANGSAEGRSGNIVVAGKTIAVSQGTACSYEVLGQGAMFNQNGSGIILPYTPPSTTIPFKKGQGDLAVHIKASCPWEVTSSPSWVRGAGFKGNGDATWHLSVDPNKGDARNGALVISGKTLVVTQESGKCSIGVKAQYAIYDSTGNSVILPYKPASMNWNDPKDLSVHLGSGKGNIAIHVTADNCPWEVTAPDWVHAPSKGTANTTVNANVKANDTPDERTGQILVGDTKITVTQDAALAEETDCEIALSNKLASFSSSGGNWTVNMTTNPGCAWTATSSVPWAKATKNPSGRGSSVIGYTIEPNTGVLRGGALFINKKLVPLIQEGAPVKEGVSD